MVTTWRWSGTTLPVLPGAAGGGEQGSPGTQQLLPHPGLSQAGLCQPQHPETAESWHGRIAPSVTQTI